MGDKEDSHRAGTFLLCNCTGNPATWPESGIKKTGMPR